MSKYKKPLSIGLIVLDVAVTVFLFIISIIILSVVVPAESLEEAVNNSSGLIKYLLQNPNIYLILFVIPLFLILAANIIGLVVYVRKTTKREPAKLSDLTAEQKEKLRQELLKDLQGVPSDNPSENK
ncbi:MAG TPA: hypothetical protein GX010_04920 [Erysipelotrichaceae bacterium]|nr:hypothetical protein [Erysipelotrichaceae bacterium]